MSLNPEPLDNKTYLGDGLYAGTDGHHVWLYTSDGIYVTNQVALEPGVLNAFLDWLKGVRIEQRQTDQLPSPEPI